MPRRFAEDHEDEALGSDEEDWEDEDGEDGKDAAEADASEEDAAAKRASEEKQKALAKARAMAKSVLATQHDPIVAVCRSRFSSYLHSVVMFVICRIQLWQSTIWKTTITRTVCH